MTTPRDALQVLARRTQDARNRIRKDRADSLLDLPYSEAAGNVRELYRLRALIDELINAEIIRGRELGAPWDLLGSSRQQAQQRAARARQRQQPLTNHAQQLRISSTAIDQVGDDEPQPEDAARE